RQPQVTPRAALGLRLGTIVDGVAECKSNSFAIVWNAACGLRHGVADGRSARGSGPPGGPGRAYPRRLRDPQLTTAEAPRAGSVVAPTAQSTGCWPRQGSSPVLAGLGRGRDRPA